MSLVAEHLSFSYPGGRELFHDASFEVEAGERVAITAPSGFGKTTLCRILAGYLAPQTGHVLVDGTALSSCGPVRPVQLLLQHPEQAFDPRMRMRSSLAEAGDTAQERCTMLSERFGLRDPWMSRLPHELSGGELMRFALVRACLACPRYLIADEATAMLDAVTQAELWHALIDLSHEEHMGMVVVSHSPALLGRVAERNLVLTKLCRSEQASS